MVDLGCCSFRGQGFQHVSRGGALRLTVKRMLQVVNELRPGILEALGLKVSGQRLSDVISAQLVVTW